MSRSKKYSPIKALTIILLSVFCFSGIPFFLKSYYQNLLSKKQRNDAYFIRDIVQIGPVKEALKTKHLAELLQLSKNKPTNLFQLDVRKGEALLLNSGIIKEAKLSLSPPHTLVIDYVIREPVAYLADYSNIVVDRQGYIFPLSPYLTPKKLTEFYLGIEIRPFQCGKIDHEKMKTALALYDLLMHPKNDRFRLVGIDVSRLEPTSSAQREIIVTLEEEVSGKFPKRYLRLTEDHYREQISYFLNLREPAFSESLIVDLRMFPDAYLTPIGRALPKVAERS